MAHPFDSLERNFALPRIRTVGAVRCTEWLAAGWHDLTRTPIASLAYGLLFSLAGDLLLVSLWRSPQEFAVAVSGFLIVAPLLCIGLYELSRHSERRRDSRFIDSLDVFSRNREGVGLFALMLALIWIAWERFSAVLFASMAPPGSSFADFVLLAAGSELSLVWLAVGGLLALTVFMLSVVSVPMLIDRDSDFVTAAVTSLRAFIANPLPLLVWAGIIVALTLLGFATLLFGLIVLMPLLGHASWHAYRDLVE